MSQFWLNIYLTQYILIYFHFSIFFLELLEKSQNCDIKSRNYIFLFIIYSTLFDSLYNNFFLWQEWASIQTFNVISLMERKRIFNIGF